MDWAPREIEGEPRWAQRPRTQALGGRPGVDPTQALGSLGEVHRAQDAQKNRTKNASTGALSLR